MAEPVQATVPGALGEEKYGVDSSNTTHIELKESLDANQVEFNRHAERSLKWKVDFLILPILSLTFLMAYMDRNNLGNAKIMSLAADVGLTAQQFYNCLMMFYVGYLVMMLPANLVLRIFGPNRTIGFGVVFFGAVVCGMSAAQNYATIMILRVLVGFGESLIQSGGLYLSLWYKRDELGTRASIYYSTSTISGVFSGLIAYGVQMNMDHVLGRRAWQWLFLLEGIPAIAVGLVIWTLLPPFPDKIKKYWALNQDEIDLAVRRSQDYNVVGAKIKWSDVWVALTEPKTYMFAFIYAALGMCSASIGSFLPTFVNDFGYSAIQAQLFTVIPYSCATVLLVAVNAVSDYFKHKFFFIIGCITTSCIGYIILMASTNVPVLVFATCLIVSGAYPAIILTFSWANVNTCGYTKRAAMWAVPSGLAQCFSIISSQVYTNPPRYLSGHGTLLAFLAWGMINAFVVAWWMRRQNIRKERVKQEYVERGEDHPDTNKTFEDVGDAHLDFKYYL